jgi:putative transposase
MRKNRFTETQIAAILQEGAAGTTDAELLRKHGISAATYYAWRAKYGGLNASELKRLKELECRPQQAEADVRGSGDGEPSVEASDQPKTVTPSEKRDAATYSRTAHCLPIARVCGSRPVSGSVVPAADRSHGSGRSGDHRAQCGRCAQWRRVFWLCHRRLRNAGHSWNHKRCWRVHCRMRPNLPRRTKRRLPPVVAQQLQAPTRTN